MWNEKEIGDCIHLENWYNVGMNYEWDEEKNQATIAERDISFEFATRIFDDAARQTELDDRFDYGESRFRTYGRIEGQLYAVAHTPRGERNTRIISARLANRQERRNFRLRQEEK